MSPAAPVGSIPHIRTPREEAAIRAALAAARPLLVRGEPGTGKTQLAEAAAEYLQRPLVSLCVNSATTPTDLLWSFDAVQRLAEAQVLAAVTTDPRKLFEQIELRRFVRPGPLWWTFDWDSAVAQHPSGEPQRPSGWKSVDGVVILIDEIDKGETDVPNGLLEALGSRRFTPTGWTQPIRPDVSAAAPLIVITTNEERSLPDPFVRRCLVLHLDLPTLTVRGGREQQERENVVFVEFLVERGQKHFGGLDTLTLRQAAELLIEDRRTALENRLRPLPGQAEYLDYLRIINDSLATGCLHRLQLDEIRSLVFRKYRRAVR